MFGILNRIFLMLLGYAYPAYECFKTVEKNKVDIEELRFWCQYWILVAILSVFERIGDIFISWLPMYGELKLAVFVYLWYPKVKGSSHIYGNIFRPYMAKHETEIDRKLMEVRAKAWDYFLFYWSNFAKIGQSTFFQVLQYMAGQSSRATSNTYTEKKGKAAEPDAPKDSSVGNGLAFLKNNNRQSSIAKNWPPTPPPSPGKLNRTSSSISTPTRSKLGPGDFSDESSTPRSGDPADLSDALYQTRLKLRRSNLNN